MDELRDTRPTGAMKSMHGVLWLLASALSMACADDAGSSSGPTDADASTGSGGVASGGSASGVGASGGDASGGNASGGVASGGHAGNVGGSAGSGGSMAGTGGAPASTGGSAGTGGAPALPCGSIATFEDGLSPTLVIHVATTGSDVDGIGTESDPYATIARAANDAVPGSAVRVHAGTYAGGAFLTDLAGSDAAPIWLGGAPDEARPVIQGGGEAFHLVRARYVVVHDLEISGQTSNGINADDGDARDDIDASRHVVFRNLSIHDVGAGGNQDCLKLSGLNDYFVLDSEFSRCGGGDSGSGIDHVGCHGGLIARNTFTELVGSGNAVQSKGGSEDIEIRWNRITDGGQRAINLGGSTGFEFFRPPLDPSQPNAEARNIRVIANLFVRSVAPIAFVGCVDCLVANNTIVDPENWVLRILQETSTGGGYTFLEAQNGSFVNNLVYFSRADLSTYANVGAGTLGGTFTFSNNLWYSWDDPAQSTPDTLPATESGGVYAQDPLLNGAAQGDYSIPAPSPAAGAGASMPELTADLTGACYADPPSAGAFEVGG